MKGRLRVRPGKAHAAGLAVAVFIGVAVAGRWPTPQDPDRQDLLNGAAGPSAAHWLGTDDLGRDITSRLLDGVTSSVVGPAVAAICATTLGLVLGLLGGFFGGRVDAVIMRCVDLVYALPALLVLIVLAGLLGGGYWAAVAIVIVLAAPGGTRIIRSVVLAQRTLPYVEAARTIGLPPHRVMVVHIVPNLVPTIVATLLLDFATVLVALSALSFLGLGLPPGSTNWGRMLAENRTLLELNPWASLAPALLIVFTALAATVIADRLHNRFQARGRDVHA